MTRNPTKNWETDLPERMIDQMSNKNKVQDWIKENFVINEIVVNDFPLFPSGQLIKDKNGDQLVIYWCIIYDRIEIVTPHERRGESMQAAKNSNIQYTDKPFNYDGYCRLSMAILERVEQENKDNGKAEKAS